jgi:DNA-binding NtrC family response regulator
VRQILGEGDETVANEWILIVDDHSMMVEVCAEILGEAGYRVGEACGGHEALDRLKADPFNLLLVDLKMPGVDGLTVLRRAREMHPGLPAVVITSYATYENTVEAFRAGASDLLLKPFDPDELLQAVRKALAAPQEEQGILLRNRLADLEKERRRGENRTP